MMSMRVGTRRRSACLPVGSDQVQAPPAMNYHRAHPEHVAKVAGNPCHAATGHNNNHALQQQQQQQQQQAHRDHGYNNSNNHGGAGSHRYETYEETCEEKTYSHQGHGHGGVARRYEYETYEEISYEEEEVVGGGGCAQLKRGYRGA